MPSPPDPSRSGFFSVLLPLPSRELSPNARLHWAAKARAVKAARKESWYWFQRFLPAGWEPKPIMLDVLYHCPKQATGYKPRDEQNAIGALKAAVDGMVDAGVIPDDSRKWLKWGNVTLSRQENGQPSGVLLMVSQETQSPPERALVTASS